MSEIPIIPRRLLLGNPSALDPKLSPDGRFLAWLAPVGAVMNVWVAPTDAIREARPLTEMGGRPPVWSSWSTDGRFVMFLKDENGDENYNLYVVERETHDLRNLTPIPKASVVIYLRSPDLPNRVLIGLNDRDARWHDVWSVDLTSGERMLVYENSAGFGWLLFDWSGQIRLAGRNEAAKGGQQIYRMETGQPEPWRLIPFDDTPSTDLVFFDRRGEHLFVRSCLNRDRSALVRIDMATNSETVLAEHPRADIGQAIWDARTFEILAVSAEHLRQEWIALDERAGRTIDMIRQYAPDCAFTRLSSSEDNTRWTIGVFAPHRPVDFFLVDRQAGALRELFSARPELKPYRLAGAQPAVVKSRDGLDLVCYVALPADEPADRPRAPLPMVLWVHGGPWGRDFYGYDRERQWLANRGYAVLNVNYRASTGFWKAFVNAGDKEHAGKMHDDLIDAVEWAIAEGIALRDKVAISGVSYGGYASFVAATFTPEVFCCSVPIVGITDLVTLLENTPPYWADFMEQFYRRYADPRTEEGREFLRSRSPLHKADRIRKPMLIAHGANDVRCKREQSDAIVAAMERLGLPVTYVLFPDEGHGFARPENNLAFHAIAEAFLARHLGGRVRTGRRRLRRVEPGDPRRRRYS